MCWSPTVTAVMVGAGAAATLVSLAQRQSVPVSATIGYFTLMEGLQLAGYQVVDQCGSPANQTITLLSFLHIVFQPFFINAFAMELVSVPIRTRTRVAVFSLCGVSSALMLLQLYPLAWAGTCRVGTILCGSAVCTLSGEWHLTWSLPYNALLDGIDLALGTRSGFPSYLAVAFVLPLTYGAWRFALFHALVGPLLASQLTSNPNEIPAIWCLFSIGIVAIALVPRIRRHFERSPSRTAAQTKPLKV